MNQVNPKTLNRDLSTSTKIFVLFAFLIIVFSVVLKAPLSGLFLPALAALFIVILVDSLLIINVKYKATWNILKWVIALGALALVTIGFL